MYDGIPLASGFQTNAQSPVDVKIVAFTIADRDAIPGIERYKGMIVTVQDSDGMGTLATYILTAQSGVTIDNTAWVLFGGGGVVNADNGLSLKSGDPTTVELGGTLLQDTNIDPATFNFYVNQAYDSSKPILDLEPAFAAIGFVDSGGVINDLEISNLYTYFTRNGTLSMQLSDTLVNFSDATGTYITVSRTEVQAAALSNTDTTAFLQADASGNITNVSISGAGFLNNADNGLSISSSTVQLGGQLIQSTIIDLNGNNLQFLQNSGAVLPISSYITPGEVYLSSDPNTYITDSAFNYFDISSSGFNFNTVTTGSPSVITWMEFDYAGGPTGEFNLKNPADNTVMFDVQYNQVTIPYLTNSDPSTFVQADGAGILRNVSLGTLGIVTGSGSATQIAFWDGATDLAGDNNLWWDNSNEFLGVGTSTPSAVIDGEYADPGGDPDTGGYAQLLIPQGDGYATSIISSYEDGFGASSITIDAENGVTLVAYDNQAVLAMNSFVFINSTNATGGYTALYLSDVTSSTTPIGSTTKVLSVDGSGQVGLFSVTSGTLTSVVAGNAIFIDNTTPAAPIVNVALDSTYNGIFINSSTGNLNTTNSGVANVMIGDNAGAANTTGFDNVFLGSYTGNSNLTGSDNLFLGGGAGVNNTSGSTNVYIGLQAGENNITANYNVAIGNLAGATANGGNNFFLGSSAGSSSTGTSNLFLGDHAGDTYTTGDDNIILGGGTASGQSGSNNLMIGAGTSFPSDTNSNQLDIGNIIYGTSIDGINNTISTGNIGIAVQAPGNRLEIANNSALATGYSGLRLGIKSTTTAIGANGKALGVDTNGDVGLYTVGTGSVTSVALALPTSVFSISGSPVTTSGTLTGSFVTQTANTVFAGPSSGSAATPTFRGLVSADMPSGFGVPGGSANDIQYNAGGTFGGSSAFQFDPVGFSVFLNGSFQAATALNTEILSRSTNSIGASTAIVATQDDQNGMMGILMNTQNGFGISRPGVLFATNGINVFPDNTVTTGSIYITNLYAGGTDPTQLRASITPTGVAIGASVTASSYLTLGAGTATAGTAPLKFTSGTNLTSIENGSMEYNGTHLYISIGGTRYQLDQQSGSGGTVTGTGTATQVAFWTGTSAISGNSNLYWDNTDGFLGLGTTTPGSRLNLAGNISAPAWGVNGINFRTTAATYTDSSSSGTVSTTTVANSFGTPTFAASSTTTYTTGATVYIAGAPSAGSLATITNPYSLYVAAGDSSFGGGVYANGAISSAAKNSTSNFFVGSAQGIANTSSAPNLFGGASTIYYRTILGANFSVSIGANNAYTNVVISSAPVGIPNSGTTPLLANLVVNPIGTITNASATPITATTSLYVNGTTTGGTSNYAALINSGTFATTGNISAPAWGVNGINFRTTAATYTDSSSSGTVSTTTVANSFGTPTFTSSNVVTYSGTLATVYIAGVPIASGNATFSSNPIALAANGQIYTNYSRTITGTGSTTDSYINATINLSGTAGGSFLYRNQQAYTINNSSIPSTDTSLNHLDITVNSTVGETIYGNETTIRHTPTTGSGTYSYTGYSSQYTPSASSLSVSSFTAFATTNSSLSTGTLANYTMFQLQPLTITNSAVGNVYAINVGDITGATGNVYALYSNISSGTSKWAIFGNGTASSYLGGNLSIGSNSITATSAFFTINAAKNWAPSSTSAGHMFINGNTLTDTATAASGTVSLVYDNYHGASSLAATNTSVTYTTAATVYIAGAPTPTGGNVTITNPFALYVNSGTSYLKGGLRFDQGSDATGDIYYRNSSGLFTRLPIGSSTNVLTVSGGIPTWAAAGGGSGTVTSVSVVSANGFAGTVATSTTTPAITLTTSITGLLFGNGTAIAAATVSSPLTYSAGTLAIQVANTSQSGYLTSTDWNTFNNKQGAITLTTTGTSGAATFSGGTLNIPQYTGGTSYTFSTGLTNTSGTITSNISTGISGGQTINGGTGSGENLTINSTSNVTKGTVFVNDNLSINVNLTVGGATYYGYSFSSNSTFPTLRAQMYYIGTGGDTWTLPAISTTNELTFTIKNEGTGILVIQSAGSDFIWTGQAVPSITLFQGNSYTFQNNSLYWDAKGVATTSGNATLSTGTKTVLTNKVTSNTLIFLTTQSLGTVSVPQALAVTAVVPGTSFTITSASITDTSVVGWFFVQSN